MLAATVGCKKSTEDITPPPAVVSIKGALPPGVLSYIVSDGTAWCEVGWHKHFGRPFSSCIKDSDCKIVDCPKKRL